MPNLWEFVPYNDQDLSARIDSSFIKRIEALRGDLQNSLSSREAELANIKAEYEKIFKTTEHRNLISLFLYSGPIGRRLKMLPVSHISPDRVKCTSRFSQMHTGDGYLDDDTRYNAFSRHFAHSNRLKRSAFLQVMHHGAVQVDKTHGFHFHSLIGFPWLHN